MEQNRTATNMNSNGWNFFVRACFAVSLGAMAIAIIYLPVTIWIKGYLAMGTLMVVTSSIMLSKSVRDDFEASKLVNRINDARTERMLQELDVKAS
ncbi:MAG: YiaA/YiaB family inner membrane protein [Acidobacteriota bacterium]|nr:YiaA/YiaB family inner membrane protein [Acidobacteriota bacterium]